MTRPVNPPAGQGLLAGVSLFAELTPDERDALACRAVVKTFRKNVVLCHEGDLTNSLNVILSGSARVYASDADGREVMLNLLGAGDYFGELSVIDAAPRSASVVTLETTRLLILARDDFLRCLRQRPGVALYLLRALAAKLRVQTERLKNLALLGVYERLVLALKELAVETDRGPVVDGVSHQQLADRVHASREMISLIFKDLRQGGYIETERKRIVLVKPLPSKW